MLIVTRKKHESIIINEEIIVKILDIKGFQVRVGIEAPDKINIRREELTPRENYKKEDL